MWIPRIVALLLLVCVAAASPPAGAAVVADLYETAVPVEDPGAEARTQGFREALGRVLVRVTGRRAAAGDPDLAPLLESAARYVQQYGYTTEGELKVVFDSTAINRALAERGQPIWGRERPLTLLWLAIDRGGGARAVLGAGAAEATVDGELLEQTRMFLQELAHERGVPLVLPLLDAEDYAALAFADICGGFEDKIREASVRYRPDAILVGCARPSPGERLRVRWSLYRDVASSHLSGGLEEGLQLAADSYAHDFATAGVEVSREIAIVVEGLASFEDYGRVLAFLQRLSLISRVVVRDVDGQSITFDVLSRAEPERLGPAITLGSLLEPAPAPAIADGEGARALYFRLRP